MVRFSNYLAMKRTGFVFALLMSLAFPAFANASTASKVDCTFILAGNDPVELMVEWRSRLGARLSQGFGSPENALLEARKLMRDIGHDAMANPEALGEYVWTHALMEVVERLSSPYTGVELPTKENLDLLLELAQIVADEVPAGVLSAEALENISLGFGEIKTAIWSQEESIVKREGQRAEYKGEISKVKYLTSEEWKAYSARLEPIVMQIQGKAKP